MGEVEVIYVIVPKQNLTQRRFGETMDLLRQDPENDIPEYKVTDPSALAIAEGGGSFVHEALIHGYSFNFYTRGIRDSRWPDIRWPIPRGTGMVYVRSGSSDTEGALLTVARALMKGLSGILASYSLGYIYSEAQTFKEFLRCNRNGFLLSKEIVDELGRDRLTREGTLVDFDGGVEFRYDRQTPEDPVRIAEMLGSASILQCDHKTVPPPDVREEEVGLEYDPKYCKSWKVDIVDPVRTAMEQVDAISSKGTEATWAREVVRKFIESDDLSIAGPLEERFFLYRKARYHEGLIRLYPEMIRYHMHRNRPGEDRSLAPYTQDFAESYMALGKFDEAKKLLEKVISYIGTRSLSIPKYKHAMCLRGLGRLEEAAEEIEVVLRIRNPYEDIWDSWTGRMLSDLASIYYEMGDLDAASKTLDRLWPFATMYMWTSPRSIIRYLSTKALVAMRSGDMDRAEDLARRSVNHVWSNQLAEAEDVSHALNALADVMDAEGEKEEAMRLRREAEEISDLGTKEEFCKKHGIFAKEI